jgi:GNAT superfamily N-acetyltransferase
MPDMLVKLYELDRFLAAYPAVAGITIRSALAPERSLVREWIEREFMRMWADEADVCFSRQPISCLIATEAGKIVGFCCYEATMRGYVGPLGVAKEVRSKGVGARLTLAALVGMRNLGYAYAIIGGVGPESFYEKVCGAWTIPNSSPGIYADMLQPDATGGSTASGAPSPSA